MNFIPQKSEPNGNYLCTWALQASAAKKLGIKGNGCADQRDALNTELLFGREDSLKVVKTLVSCLGEFGLLLDLLMGRFSSRRFLEFGNFFLE